MPHRPAHRAALAGRFPAMYTDDDLLPISALQHLQYCERQCALIHIEHIWSENTLTAEGRVLHDRVDGGGHETRGTVRTVYSLRLRSLRLGLTGQADVVEFHRGETGIWMPYPVEFKRGKPKSDPCDRVQLCAQALCLEEMKGVAVAAGSLFYGETRHRCEVPFDAELRSLTESLCARLHDLVASGVTPSAVYDKGKCGRCSLLERCLPRAGGVKSAQQWLDARLAELDRTGGCL